MDKRFLELAVYNAKISMEHGGFPFGAVVVCDGKVVGTSDVTFDKNDPTAHAETRAIRDASMRLGTHDLSHCEIYSSCEPCGMCESAIKWARIPKAYYAFDRKDAETIGQLAWMFMDDTAKLNKEKIYMEESRTILEDYCRKAK